MIKLLLVFLLTPVLCAEGECQFFSKVVQLELVNDHLYNEIFTQMDQKTIEKLVKIGKVYQVLLDQTNPDDRIYDEVRIMIKWHIAENKKTVLKYFKYNYKHQYGPYDFEYN